MTVGASAAVLDYEMPLRMRGRWEEGRAEKWKQPEAPMTVELKYLLGCLPPDLIFFFFFFYKRKPIRIDTFIL